MKDKVSILYKGRILMDTPKFFFTNEYQQFRSLLKQHSCSERFYPKGDTVFSSETDLDFCLYIDKVVVRNYNLIKQYRGKQHGTTITNK